MPKARPDKAEFAKRLLIIQGWMIDGAPSTLIIQQIMLKQWAKSDRHAYILLQKAREQWIKYENDNVAEKRKMKVQELKNRIRSMSNEYKGTPAGMRAILAYEKEIIKLEGLYFLPVKSTHDNVHEEDYIAPVVIADTNDEIDYTKLSDAVLEQIAAARLKQND